MKVYAHRGYSGKYPENTMLAFRKAAETGCDGIELDVHLSKDGQVVIIHDEKVDRTTGKSGFVKDFTCKELSEMDAGQVMGGIHGFQGIPSFEEYCAWVKDENIITNIELKSGVYYYENLEAKAVELIRKYGLEKKVLFSSFNHMSLVCAKELAPEIPCGALISDRGLGNAGYYCDRYGFECYHPGYAGLTTELVDNCKAHGIQLNVWDVNNMGDLEQLYEWDGDGVISNYPDVCTGWLKSKTM